MQITAFKCPTTGRLFETQSGFDEHMAQVAKEHAIEQANLPEAVKARNAIAAQIRNVTTLREYFKLLNLFEANKSSYCGNVNPVIHFAPTSELEAPNSRGLAAIDVMVYYSSISGHEYYSPFEAPRAPGLLNQVGHRMVAPPGEGPAGATHLLKYHLYLDMLELPKLYLGYQDMLSMRADYALTLEACDAQAIADMAKDEQYQAENTRSEKLLADSSELRARAQALDTEALALASTLNRRVRNRFEELAFPHKQFAGVLQLEANMSVLDKASSPA
jgi:hypothetical protein